VYCNYILLNVGHMMCSCSHHNLLVVAHSQPATHSSATTRSILRIVSHILPLRLLHNITVRYHCLFADWIGLDWVEFNTPPDTVYVILEAVFDLLLWGLHTRATCIRNLHRCIVIIRRQGSITNPKHSASSWHELCGTLVSGYEKFRYRHHFQGTS